jgi:hypothetical protein
MIPVGPPENAGTPRRARVPGPAWACPPGPGPACLGLPAWACPPGPGPACLGLPAWACPPGPARLGLPAWACLPGPGPACLGLPAWACLPGPARLGLGLPAWAWACLPGPACVPCFRVRDVRVSGRPSPPDSPPVLGPRITSTSEPLAAPVRAWKGRGGT